MVVLPLLYPQVFSKFHVAPPRGVLFYGPPGTGKTLMARALVNECSQDGKRVAFFMRKGSDVLSKWVGESERQLRLLFDQAFQERMKFFGRATKYMTCTKYMVCIKLMACTIVRPPCKINEISETMRFRLSQYYSRPFS